jgi:DNA-binding SARP family transcriptional activator
VLARVRVPEVRALRLDRLESRLATVWDRRLGVVVAPAGSGKTTLLAGFAGSLDVPVAWYRAETWDARSSALLRHLHTAIGAALPNGPGSPPDGPPWTSVEAAAASIEAWSGSRLLLIVDDLHALEGTEAESALERLIDYAPDRLAVIVASRTQPGFNLSRRRVEGALLEITSDDLRFRSWEVERLFRDIYGLSIPPQELAVLARRTEGWAAGLQLFRLAIEGKSADERRRLLAGGSSGRYVREYLARNVLAELPPELRSFLVETCVLGRLNGSLCDGLLERRGTAAVLEELERRQIFTTRHDDGSYRYHEVLRSHLEAILIETRGEAAARERYGQAGRLLLAQEEIGEALVAFARAADWDAVERVVRSRGERLVADGAAGAWFDALPSALARNDPWLMLAAARRARDDGRWAQAADAFLVAESAFGSSEGAGIARRERSGLVPWIERRPRPPAAADGPGLLRAAVSRDPQAVAAAATGLDGAWRNLVGGMAALLAGRPDDARRELAAAAEHPAASPALAQGAALGAAASSLLAGRQGEGWAMEPPAGPAAVPWLVRIARAVAVLDPGADGPDRAELDQLRRATAEAGDPWGELLVGLIAGWAGVITADDPGVAIGLLEQTAERAAGQGAGVLEAWALAFAAVIAVRAGDPRAPTLVGATNVASRASACRGPAALVARLSGAAREAADTTLVGSQVAIPQQAPRVPETSARSSGGAVTAPQSPSPGVRIRCFGEYRFELDGRPLAHTSIRPRARSVLHLLSVNAGEPVHREVLEAAIWPSEATGAAAARLHVAISSIRHLLQGDRGRTATVRIDRDRETYRLVLPDSAELDTRAFEDAVTTARAGADGDRVLANVAAERAVALYGGALLVEEGPAEWVLEPRERFRALAIEAIQIQATLARLRGDHAAMIAACTTGLALERYHDPFWRLLIEAREMAGDRGAAVRAEADYRGMLAQLGVTPSLTGAGPR